MADIENPTDQPPPGNQLLEGRHTGPEFRGDVRAQVTMQRTHVDPTPDRGLWGAIRNRTTAIGFDAYSDFIEKVLAEPAPLPLEYRGAEPPPDTVDTRGITKARDLLMTAKSIMGVDAYQLLKMATQAFLLFETGVTVQRPRNWATGEEPPQPQSPRDDEVPDEAGRVDNHVTFHDLKHRLSAYLLPSPDRLPYLDRIVRALLETIPEEGNPYGDNLLKARLTAPSLIELVWSYWHEEGMLAQTMNAISLRFQNKRGPADRDPLANLEIDSLRPLNNLLWGFIQDEYNRLTVVRRAYEYDHQYGLTLYGRAVPELRTADSRSKFIEAFHNLLYRAAAFYRADSDTTVIADGFPLLNSLKEVHLLLAEGAHNQFGDLPWTARAEMLLTQWLLSRREMKEFLRGRAAVPYQESWMGQVDTMKRLQGWTDTSVTHFRNLGVFGEQVLLSVRYGDWSVINNQDNAKIWARYWRPEVQSYIHAYLSATGVDLGEEIRDTRSAGPRYAQPSVLLRQRIVANDGQGALSPGLTRAALPAPGASSTTPPLSRRRALKAAKLSGKD
jgi:hypothetical protein